MNTKELQKIKDGYILLCSYGAAQYDYKKVQKIIGKKTLIYFENGYWKITNSSLFRHEKPIDHPVNRSSYVSILRNLKKYLDMGAVVAVLAETHPCFDGVNQELTDFVCKFVCCLNAPVYALYTHGDYLERPLWSNKYSKIKKEISVESLISIEEVAELKKQEIIKRVKEKFHYDEYEWKKGTMSNCEDTLLVEGIERVLYQCPCCKKEDVTATRGKKFYCLSCKSNYKIGLNGEIYGGSVDPKQFELEVAALKQEEIRTIPDWTSFEKRMLLRSMLRGEYQVNARADVFCRCPQKKDYTKLGEATVKHSLAGLTIYMSGDMRKAFIDKKPYQLDCIRYGIDSLGKNSYIEIPLKTNSYRLILKDQTNDMRLIQAIEIMTKMINE